MSSSAPHFSLHRLASIAGGSLVNTEGNEEILHLSLSSIECRRGSLFFAVQGTKSHGHMFVHDAFERNAAAAVVENREALQGRPGIVVTNAARSAGEIARVFWGNDTSDFSMIGITGTNGKTTTNWIVHELLIRLQGGALRVGTLGARCERVDGQRRVTFLDDDCHLTTPDSLTLHRYIAEARHAGVRSAVVEVSAHGLVQERVSGVQFQVALFTNLTQDHLDYFPDMEAYFEAKRLLFTKRYLDRGVAVVNVDDPFGDRLSADLDRFGIRVVRFGRSRASQVSIRSEQLSPEGIRMQLGVEGREFCIESPFIGAHNSENLTAAILAVHALGFPIEQIAPLVTTLPQPRGRLERVSREGAPTVFVDYAHTPDALERALLALRKVSLGRLWVVFGCGGDRDRKKRPIMGAIASRLADEVVVTSDNPRSEDPVSIISEITRGMSPETKAIPDRREAITEAISRARSQDVILIAGKGHEDYQIIGSQTIHFSDVEVAQEALTNRCAGD